VTGDVRLLSLDAGNTIVFLDHDAVAEVVAATAGVSVTAPAIERAEGIAKKKLDAKQLLSPVLENQINRAWGAFMATLVQVATGVEEAWAAECARALWREHRRFNLWRKVPDGLVDGVAEVRAAGVRVVVVSNSEGELQSLFDKLEIGGAFDLVIDSHHVGVEKPDPRIFRLALERFGVAAEQALHLGDSFATDVAGARAAGLRVALVDPYGHYDGEYLDVPRVADVASVCRALVSGSG
jgi:HAD superfamily hydrolase (TIGR01549 family)